MCNVRIFLTSCLAVLIILSGLSHATASEVYSLNESFVQNFIDHTSMGRRYETKKNVVTSGMYVADGDVIRITGWDYDQQPLIIRYDTTVSIKVAGTDVMLRVHHFKGKGLDIYIDWGSYKIRRQVFKTSKRYCSDVINYSLNPGHEVFEVHLKNDGFVNFATGMALVNYSCNYKYVPS